MKRFLLSLAAALISVLSYAAADLPFSTLSGAMLNDEVTAITNPVTAAEPSAEENTQTSLGKIYFDNSESKWTEVYVYAYKSSDGSIKNAPWPGVAMTLNSEGLYEWEVTSEEFDMVVFNNGKVVGTAQTSDHDLLIGRTYNLSGLITEDDPTQTYPETLYLIGHIEGLMAFDPADDRKPLENKGNGIYEINGVTVTDAGSGYGTFYFTSAIGDWETVQSSAYGAEKSGQPINSGDVVKVININNTWTLAPGTYKFTVNLADMTFTVSDPESIPYVVWDSNTKTLSFKAAITKEEGDYVYDLNTGENYPAWLLRSISDNCTKVVFEESFKDVRPTTCLTWYFNFVNLSSIEGLENLNTEEVTNMQAMFYGCSGLQTLDLTSFNTGNVTNMEAMFYGCSGLQTLDLTSFNTSCVEKMYSMFHDCTNLKTIYVSDDFVLKENTISINMFLGCSSLSGATAFDERYEDGTMANYKDGYFKTYFRIGDSEIQELYGENMVAPNPITLDDNKELVINATFDAKISYSRTLPANTMWGTLCLPFAYTPNGFTAYELQSAEGSTIVLKAIGGQVAAGTPVIIKSDDETTSISFSEDNAKLQRVQGGSATADSQLQLMGTYKQQLFTQEDNDCYILKGGMLMNPAKLLEVSGVNTVGMKPYRVYVKETVADASAAAKSYTFFADEETSIEDRLNTMTAEDAEYFDMQGRRIGTIGKGINIIRRGNKTLKVIIR